MMTREINWKATRKQLTALKYLRDSATTEILFGGGAGGAKSFLGCAWIVLCCLAYPETRYLIGRKTLKDLKQSTLLTFFDVCKRWGMKADDDYDYNAIEGTIIFRQTGSMVFLRELDWLPSDPEYDRLGSFEYTAVFIDEAQQVREKAKNIVATRIRYKLEEFGLIPKLLMTCNPNKGFLYADFYKPQKEKSLPAHRAFIQSLVHDNPYIAKAYIDNLRKLDKATQERLLKGNWEYDDDPTALIEYEAILDLFSNTVDGGDKYLTGDIARWGSDKIVIYVWEGFLATKVYTYQKQGIDTTEKKIREIAAQERIPFSHIAVDDDGVGGGITDHMRGIRGFVNNSRALENPKTQEKENYENLKTQCYYILADKINRREIAVRTDNPEIKKALIEDLEQVKSKDADKDGPKRIMPKEEVKQLLGRSPDYSDALMIRMFFELKPKGANIRLL